MPESSERCGAKKNGTAHFKRVLICGISFEPWTWQERETLNTRSGCGGIRRFAQRAVYLVDKSAVGGNADFRGENGAYKAGGRLAYRCVGVGSRSTVDGPAVDGVILIAGTAGTTSLNTVNFPVERLSSHK